MQKIKFYCHDRTLTLKERKKLKIFIISMFVNEKKQLNKLSYIFCSDEYLLGINKEFLQHDFYTDVVTFDLSIKKKEISGEIYISTERIKENAKNEKVSFSEELHRVIFHAALHLCGYKDKKKSDIQKMRSTEEKYLKNYFG